MLNQKSIRSALESIGFAYVRENKKVIKLRKNDLVIYIKSEGETRRLVIHPKYEGLWEELASLRGVETHSTLKFYHNADLDDFPKRQNTGQGPTNNGLDFDFLERSALVSFFKVIDRENSDYSLTGHDSANIALSPEAGRNQSSFAYKPLQLEKNDEIEEEKLLRTALERLAKSVMNTVKQSNGQTVQVIKKNKTTSLNETQLRKEIETLLKTTDRCALTGLKFELVGRDNGNDFQVSLDRIDSSRGYEKDNMQLTCWFANRWKSDSDQTQFLSLLSKVRDVDFGSTT